MKTIFVALLLLMSIYTQAQEPVVAPHVAGVQIGIWGTELYHEAKLSYEAALRTELAVDMNLRGSIRLEKEVSVYPRVSIQPKYYYNITRRATLDKNTRNNAANYLSVQLNYFPSWIMVKKGKSEIISLVPTFGFRRNFAKNFNYEFRIGIGYGAYFGKGGSGSDIALDLSFKVGYDFLKPLHY